MSNFHDRNHDHHDKPKGPQLKQADKDYYRQQEEARQVKSAKKEMPLYAANMDEQIRDMSKAARRNNLTRKHDDSAWWHKRDMRRKEKRND